MNENKPNKRKKYQKYSPQFMDQALARAAKDGIPQAAKDLGIQESVLYSWLVKQKNGEAIHWKIKSFNPLKWQGLSVRIDAYKRRSLF